MDCMCSQCQIVNANQTQQHHSSVIFIKSALWLARTNLAKRFKRRLVTTGLSVLCWSSLSLLLARNYCCCALSDSNMVVVGNTRDVVGTWGGYFSGCFMVVVFVKVKTVVTASWMRWIRDGGGRFACLMEAADSMVIYVEYRWS